MTALMGLTSRLKVAKLHLITDVRREQGDFREFVVEALHGGVDLLQVRDARASEEELAEALAIAQSAALQLNATVVAGTSLSVAERFRADVVHVGAAGSSVDSARRVLPQHSLVGRSVHDSAALRKTRADYLMVGPVFGESFEGVRFPGLDLVRDAAATHRVDDPRGTPWFAVGGIDAGTIERVVEAGALRVAVSSAITRAADPQSSAAALKKVLLEAWGRTPGMEEYALKAFGGGQGLSFAPRRVAGS
ncbi:thiamine phosphate synthase [Luteococcus sp.]|uniref:thiamine phosphate synthase n=1 Tax=Luteococcus sp. TaxID=1969402 RepID=UPI0037359F8A